jgi:two-component system chemotaxis response regulator CheY
MTEERDSLLSDIIDLIERLEQQLLTFEEILDTNSDKTELVHQVFRIAHNLKSTLGMAQRHCSSELIHAVESNFDLIRNGVAEATPLLVHKALMAVDAIRFNVFLQEEQRADLAALQQELEDIFHYAQTKSASTSKIQVSVQFQLTERQRKLLAGMVQENFNVFQIEKIINPQQISQQTYENLPIYDDIREVGIHIATYPEYEHLSKKEPETVIRIVLATTFQLDELEMHIFDPVKPVDVASLLQKSSAAQVSAPVQAVPQAIPPQTASPQVAAAPSSQPALAAKREVRAVKKMNILIAEDDFVSRTVIHEILSPFGVCDLAADGREALLAFEHTLKDGGHYDLVCLDIMMPIMDGTQALTGIRELEEQFGIRGNARSKIVMTTALDSMDQVFKAFRLQCDAYVTKPLSRAKILNQLRKLHIIEH